MNIFLFIDKVFKTIKKRYREYIFYKKTGTRASLIDNVILTNVNIHSNDRITIYPGVHFSGNGLIEIGEKCFIGKDSIIYSSSIGGVKIGNNVSIAAQCYIIDTDHGIEKNDLIQNNELISSKIIIEDDVWIGAGAKILKGSHIHKGAVIGAQSVIKGDIPEYAVCVGVPGKIIKYRINK